MIVVLTGPSGAGKTTVCLDLASRARARSITLGGVLTVRRLSGGLSAGLDVLDVSTGERRPLAERQGPTDGPSTDHWHFHRQGLDWGLSRAKTRGDADLFLLDEIGPLELVRGEAWVQLFDVLSARRHGLAVVVVRPSLVVRFIERLRASAVESIDVSVGNRESLPSSLLQRLTGAP